MAEQPTPIEPAELPHRRWLDFRSMIHVLGMPEIGLLVLTFFLATFAFANFEGTLALLNKALGLSDAMNGVVFTAVGFTLILCQGLIYRRLAKRVPERTFTLLGLVLMAVGLACIGGVAALGVTAVPPSTNSLLGGMIIGLLQSTFSTMQFVFAPIWGRISDNIGRRPILLLGLAGSVVFYTLFGIGAELGTHGWLLIGLIILFLARSGQGIAGATIATAQAVIADCTTKAERSRGMAMIGAAFGIGFTIGPAVGAAMLAAFPDFQGGPCFLAAAVSLIALVIGLRSLPETLRTKTGGGPASPTALRIVFLVVVIDLMGFGLVLPQLPRIGDDIINPLLAGQTTDSPTTTAPVTAEVAEIPPSPLGAGVVAIGVLFAVGLILSVMGFSFLTPSIQSLISRRTDPTRQGEVLGVNQSASALARILGPTIGTILLRSAATPFLPFVVAAALLLILVLPATRIRRDDSPAPLSPTS